MLTANTYVLGKVGLVTVAELFASVGYSATCTSRAVPQMLQLVNEHGMLEPTSHFTWNNRRPIHRITTGIGLELAGSTRHAIRVMGTDGLLVWRKIQNLSVGDTVAIGRGMSVWGGGELSQDQASLLGLLVADGALTDRSRIALSNSDPAVVALFKRAVRSTLGEVQIKSYPRVDNPNSVNHHVGNTADRTWLRERFGMDYVLAADKTVPLCVRTAGRTAVIAFLQAFFECECSIDPGKPNLEVVSASRRLLHVIQLLLLNLGLLGVIYDKPANGTVYYRLVLAGDECARFAETVGFISQARKETYAQCSVMPHRTRIDTIPHLGPILQSIFAGAKTTRQSHDLYGNYVTGITDVTYDRLAEILNHFGNNIDWAAQHHLAYLRQLRSARYFFDQVVGITEGEEPVFDVVMPRTRSCWSGGLISHTAIHTPTRSQLQRQSCHPSRRVPEHAG